MESSTGSIPAANGTSYATNTNPYQSRSVQRTLAPGTYQIGFGVVDVDGSGNSSAFLLDNFDAQAVPFDFSPTAGLVSVASIFGLSRLRRKFRNDKTLASDRKS